MINATGTLCNRMPLLAAIAVSASALWCLAESAAFGQDSEGISRRSVSWPRPFARRNPLAGSQQDSSNPPKNENSGPVGNNTLTPPHAGDETVQPVRFQQPAPRVYQNPPQPFTPGYNPYDATMGQPSMYGPPYFGLPGYGFPDGHPEPIYLPPSTNLPPQAENRPSVPSPVVPGANDPRQWESMGDLPSVREYAEPSSSGQGYLQYGSTFQGRQLNPQPATATERALEMMEENQRLRDALGRAHHELETRNKELEDARAASRRIGDELSQAIDRIRDLNHQLARLTKDLNLALEDRNAIERRANEQLRSIESMLDGILLETISDRGGR
ncbi:MAG TPA: hypothetical protein PKD54_04860 [Pirellulaceae bacterium]|nr:hypothetical protein [Pirellulaceae bacterium]